MDAFFPHELSHLATLLNIVRLDAPAFHSSRADRKLFFVDMISR